MTSSLVVFMGLDRGGKKIAARLGTDFCRRVRALTGVVEAMQPGPPVMPCSSLIPGSFSCHAVNKTDCRKLLVLIGDDPAPASARKLRDLSGEAQQWIASMAGNNQWDVLPVLRAGLEVNQMLPPELQHKNVAYWHANVESEILPGVFQRAGLAPEDYRIFISYIRRETTALAEQLHDALTRQGFAVFVDRFSVPVGVDFQERLMQELTDRGMMLLLHSPSLGDSDWVEKEIATVMKFRMGLYVLRLPGVPERASLLPDRSRLIQASEWNTDKLTDAALSIVVQEIKRIHHEAHHRQLERLANALVAAMYDPARGQHGCTLRPEAGGLFVITRPAGLSNDETSIHLTARPPELKDFYHLHVVGNIPTRGRGGIIAPAPFIIAQRQAWFDWLGCLANLRHTDEGQLNNAVDQIIAGTF